MALLCAASDFDSFMHAVRFEYLWLRRLWCRPGGVVYVSVAAAVDAPPRR